MYNNSYDAPLPPHLSGTDRLKAQISDADFLTGEQIEQIADQLIADVEQISKDIMMLPFAPCLVLSPMLALDAFFT